MRPVARPTVERALPFLLAVIYVAVGLVVAADPASMHDEGLLTYGGARALGDDFVPIFFFQKVRPALCLLYLPIARFGLHPFLALHVLVSAAAIPLVAATARALGIRSASIAAVAVAVSPLFLWCGPTGLSNSDGVVVMSLVLYLLATRRWPFLAGALLGALPWIRYEIVPLALALVVYILMYERRRPIVLGLLLWPVIYEVGGAFYHRDVMWFLHFPPGLAQPMKGNLTALHLIARHDAGTLVAALLGVTPLLVILPFVRWRSLHPLERTMLLMAIFNVVLFGWAHLFVLHVGQLWMLGASPRYAMQVLPFAAIVAARAVDRMTQSGDEAAPASDPSARDAVVLVGSTSLARVARRWAALPILAAVFSAPFLLRHALEHEGFRRSEEVRPLTAAASEAAASTGASALVFTNVAILGSYVQRAAAASRLEVRFLLQADQLDELHDLSNPSNGQRDRVAVSFTRAVFGEVVDPATLRPDLLPTGTLFVLRDDERNELSLPKAVWAPWFHRLLSVDRVQLREIRSMGDAAPALDAEEAPPPSAPKDEVPSAPSAEAIALLDGLRVGDALAAVRVRRISGPSKRRIEIDTEGDDLRLILVVTARGVDPHHPPGHTERYDLFYESASGAEVSSEDALAALQALAARVHRAEGVAPPPPGM